MRNTRKLLLAAAVVVLGTSAASAATLCASGSVVGAFGAGSTLNLTPSATCQIGATIFSNFFVTANTNNAPNNFQASATLLNDGHTLSLTYSNLGSADIQFGFQSSGLIIPGLLLGGGSATTVTEGMCSVAFTGESCLGGTLLGGFVTVTNGGSALIGIAGTNGNVFYSKDILGGSGVTQTLIPEPTTISLMGAGLIGLGLLRRKLRK